MRTLAKVTLLLFAAASWAKEKPTSKSCEDRCVGSVKYCTQACEKQYPAAKRGPCVTGCSAAVAPCKEHCKTEGAK